MKSRRNKSEPNYWAAYADCMLALFMIALLLWILSSGKTIFANMATDPGPPVPDPPTWDLVYQLRAEIKKLEAKLAKLEELLKTDGNALRLKLAENEAEIQKLTAAVANLIAKNIKLIAENKQLTAAVAKLVADNQRLTAKVARLERELKAANKKPPIIKLAEGNRKFRFDSGSAVLSEDFRDELWNKQFPKLLKNLQDFQVNTIEIIGHTDADPVKDVGNLDDRIPGVILNNDPVAGLKAGSNADLGLMRALAIREAWLKWKADQKFKVRQFLEPIDIRCYSAAQTIPPDGAVGKDLLMRRAPNPAARRIEIRVTFLEK